MLLRYLLLALLLGCLSGPRLTLAQTLSVSVQPSCPNGSSGRIEASLSGGITPLTFILEDGAGNVLTSTSGIFADLAPGDYRLVATDDTAGSDTIDPVTILTAPLDFLALDAALPPACAGSSNGLIVVSNTGAGQAPFLYQLDGGAGQPIGVFANLPAGTYDVTATDNRGCVDQESGMVLTDPPALVLSNLASAPITCTGDSNGSIVGDHSGGTGPVSIALISNGDTLSDGDDNGAFAFSDLATGAYLILATDANGCQATASVSVNAPDTLRLSVTNITNSGCSGIGTGSITLLATGGNGGYQYSLLDSAGPQASGTFGSLAGGSYVPQVVDAQGCTTVLGSQTINEGNLTLTTISASGPSCNGGSNGSLLFIADGGTLPITYELSGASSQTFSILSTVVIFSGLPAGNFTLEATDAIGCRATVDTTLAEPAPLALTLTNLPTGCQGQLSANATGGTQPYTFFLDGVSVGSTFQDTLLPNGTYTVQVVDANGCQVSDTRSVGVSGAVAFDSLQATQPLCFDSQDGSISYQLAGTAPPFDVTVSDSTQSVTFISAPQDTVFNLGGDATYTLTVSDALGCTDTRTIFLDRPAPLSFTLSSTEVACFGESTGSITVQNQQGGIGPYQFRLTSVGTPQASPTFPNLSAGAYQVQLIDTNGCVSAPLTETVAQPSAPLNLALVEVTDTLTCQGDTNGLAVVEITGGTINLSNAYQFQLESLIGSGYQIVQVGSLATSDTIAGLTTGQYRIRILDSRNCTVSDSFSIAERDPIAWREVEVDSVRCGGDSNGQVRFLGLSGGNPPYAVSWANATNTVLGNDAVPDTTAEITDLPTGLFTFVLTDTAGCTSDTALTVPAPDSLQLTLNADSSRTFIPCHDGDNGRVQLEATGGNPGAFDFFLQSALRADSLLDTTSQVRFEALSAGDSATLYEFTVEDRLGCQALLTVWIEEDTPLVPTFLPNDSTFCQNEDTILLRGTGKFLNAQFRDTLGYVVDTTAQAFWPGRLPSSASEQVVSLFLFGRDTTAANCPFFDTVQVTVYDTLPITGLVPDTFCSNDPNKILPVAPMGGTITGAGVLRQQDDSLLFVPNLFPDGDTLPIRYVFRDSAAGQCISRRAVAFVVRPTPGARATVLTDPLCQGQPIALASTNPGDSLAHLWVFRGDTLADRSDSVVVTLGLGDVSLVYRLTDLRTDCSDTYERELAVQAVPRFRFDWSRICEGDTVQLVGSLTDSSNLSNVNTLRWHWRFGDGAQQTDQLDRAGGWGRSQVSHAYAPAMGDDPQAFLTQLVVQTDSGCADTLDQAVTILPTLRPTAIEPYAQHFDQDSLPWLVLDGSDAWSWVPLNLSDSINLNPPFGTGNFTVQPNAPYDNDLRGDLLSPCFDLSGLMRPVISLDIYAETELGADGVVLQYLNESQGANDWQTLGSVSEGVATGLNWYTRSNLFARPGAPNLQGWSGDFGGYRQAAHGLDQNDLAGPTDRSRVRFRLAFAADDRNRGPRGFALDAVRIDERRRQVLWETFEDAGAANAAADSVRDALDSLRGDFLALPYQMNGEYVDQAPTPPRARSLYYGISLSHQAVLDGSVYNGPTGAFALNRMNLRSLSRPLLDSLYLTAGRAQVRLAAVHDTATLALRLALVERLDSARSVVRAILPDAAGTILALRPGDTLELPLATALEPTTELTVEVADAAQLHAVMWVQDVATKEVGQATRLDGLDWQALLPNLSLQRRRQPAPATRPRTLRVYPVPTTGSLTVALPAAPATDWPVWLLDAQGRLLRQVSGAAGQTQLPLDLRALPEGLYHVRLRDPIDGSWHTVPVPLLR